jgi:hypothetical protein
MDKPTGQRFIGAAVIEAASLESALVAAMLCNCNPGTDVLGIEIPEEIKVPKKYRNRLMSISELKDFDEKICGGIGLETIRREDLIDDVAGVAPGAVAAKKDLN